MDKKLMISVFAFIILLAGALYFGKGNTVNQNRFQKRSRI